MYETTFDGVRFVEGRPREAQLLSPVSVRIGGIIKSAQLRNLDDVKRLMVDRVREQGGNAVVDFRYGQRSVGFLASLLQRDDVNWYGEGTVAILPARRGKSTTA